MWQDANYAANSINTYGAPLCRSGLDMTAEIRVRRMLGVFCGRSVLNSKTARSHSWRMIWGLSMALHEEAVVDMRTGGFVNRDLPISHAGSRRHPGTTPCSMGSTIRPTSSVQKESRTRHLCGRRSRGHAVFNATGVRVRSFHYVGKAAASAAGGDHMRRSRRALPSNLA